MGCKLFIMPVLALLIGTASLFTDSKGGANKAFSGWTELFHDQVIVTAFLDRLLHHSVAINIRGNICRLRGKVGKEGVEMGRI